jgi:hypothetical protein
MTSGVGMMTDHMLDKRGVSFGYCIIVKEEYAMVLASGLVAHVEDHNPGGRKLTWDDGKRMAVRFMDGAYHTRRRFTFVRRRNSISQLITEA